MEFTALPDDAIGVIAAFVFTPRFTLARQSSVYESRVSINTGELNDLVHLQMTCERINALVQHKTKNIACTLRRYHATLKILTISKYKTFPVFDIPASFSRASLLEPVLYLNALRKQLVRKLDENQASVEEYTVEQLDQLYDKLLQQLNENTAAAAAITPRPQMNWGQAYQMFLKFSR